MITVYQHIDEFKDGDGIGNDIKGIHNLLIENGIESYIICNKTNQKDSYVLNPKSSFTNKSKDIHILHYGNYGYPIEYFLSLKGKKVLRYHNITPAFFFKDFCNIDLFNQIVKDEMRSYIELNSLIQYIDFWLFDSSFNYRSLVDMLRLSTKINMEVLPIFKSYNINYNLKKSPSYQIGFIGRIVPNKKVEDLLFLLKKLIEIDNRYKLFIVGKKIDAFGQYYEYIQSIGIQLGLTKHITIHQNLKDDEVYNLLKNWDFLVTLSEHEGFCIPILESFGSGVPVIAYNSSAIPETMKGVGVLINYKDYRYIAELINLLNCKYNLKETIIKRQLEVAQFYNNFQYSKLISILNNLIV